MDDFDVVTGPAPGLAAKLKPPAPAEQKRDEQRLVSPPSPPSPSKGEAKKGERG
jgi:hypothetical protein